DGPAMADLISGQVQVGFATMTASIGYIRAERLRPLAVTTGKRSDALPGIPSVSEFVPGFEASSWFGIAAPKATPAEIVASLNRETNAGLADPTIKARLVDIGGMLLTGSPADFGKLIADETEKWGKVIREAGIKAEENRQLSAQFHKSRYANDGVMSQTGLGRVKTPTARAIRVVSAVSAACPPAPNSDRRADIDLFRRRAIRDQKHCNKFLPIRSPRWRERATSAARRA